MTSHIRTIDLGDEQLMVFEGGPGERVRVLCGAAWLTQEGEPATPCCGRAPNCRCAAGAR